MAADAPILRREVDNHDFEVPAFLPPLIRDHICSLVGDIMVARRFCPPASARTFIVMHLEYATPSENIAAITEAQWRVRTDHGDADAIGEVCELCGIRTDTLMAGRILLFSIPMHREVDTLPLNKKVMHMIDKAMYERGCPPGVGEGQTRYEERLCCFRCTTFAAVFPPEVDD